VREEVDVAAGVTYGVCARTGCGGSGEVERATAERAVRGYVQLEQFCDVVHLPLSCLNELLSRTTFVRE
jgi:hypothetical protein